MKYTVEISQNGWEYTGFAFIEATTLTKHQDDDNNFIIADGVKISFDEAIGEVTDESGDSIPHNAKDQRGGEA